MPEPNTAAGIDQAQKKLLESYVDSVGIMARGRVRENLTIEVLRDPAKREIARTEAQKNAAYLPENTMATLDKFVAMENQRLALLSPGNKNDTQFGSTVQVAAEKDRGRLGAEQFAAAASGMPTRAPESGYAPTVSAPAPRQLASASP
jgi:hypothetical protein